MNEKTLQNKVIEYLKKLKEKNIPVFWNKRQSGGWNYRIGLPDLYVVINGKHLEIEIKSPERDIVYKPEQLLWKTEFEKLNIPHLISNNYQEIVGFIIKNGEIENE